MKMKKSYLILRYFYFCPISMMLNEIITWLHLKKNQKKIFFLPNKLRFEPNKLRFSYSIWISIIMIY